MGAIINNYLHIFLTALIPVAELRLSIPLGAVSDLPWFNVFVVSVIGNMLPVPFILLFIRQILKLMKKIPFLAKIALWVEKKAEKNKERILNGAFIGLVLFVGIPLPGTGAWTGALCAALFDMRLKRALPAIFFGILLAATIMTVASYGSVSFLSFLLPKAGI